MNNLGNLNNYIHKDGFESDNESSSDIYSINITDIMNDMNCMNMIDKKTQIQSNMILYDNKNMVKNMVKSKTYSMGKTRVKKYRHTRESITIDNARLANLADDDKVLQSISKLALNKVYTSKRKHTKPYDMIQIHNPLQSRHQQYESPFKTDMNVLVHSNTNVSNATNAINSILEDGYKTETSCSDDDANC